jgi:membrane peptidoglycan carboxypeptidase
MAYESRPRRSSWQLAAGNWSKKLPLPGRIPLGAGLAQLSLIVVASLLFTGVIIAGSRLFRAASAARSPEMVISENANYGGAQIYDRNDKLLYRFPDASGGIRIPLQVGHVSRWMVDATVSTEDAGFWSNGGIDPLGTLRSATTNIAQHGTPFVGGGGSGITQQLVKQTLIPSNQRETQSVARKITEALLAIGITRTYSKSQILQWYLDIVNYGSVYDGVESAAEGYFGVNAANLDLAQSAMLAGIPQSPAAYSPYSDPARSKERQAEVLDLMVKHHDIEPQQAEAAKAEPLNYRPEEQALPMQAPWFVEYVRQDLIRRFGQRCFETCGLQVRTSLDLDLEDQASQILDANLAKSGDPIGAHDGSLVSIDALTGEILVMVGSRNYDDESPSIQGKNNFTVAVMQPGSSFKPFVYLSLFMRQAYGPESIIWDAPFTAPDGYRCQDPVQGGRTQGPIPVRLALGSSLNCAANRAAQVTGIQNIIDTAHAVGITTMDNAAGYGPSIATGGANITLLDMTYAYATLARNGNMIGQVPIQSLPQGYRQFEPDAVLEVWDGQGKVVYTYQPRSAQVVPPGYPYLVTSIISDCANRRLIWQCGFPEFLLADGRPVAVKTGTQQGSDTSRTIANWQYMYTPQLVTGGWVGNANRTAWTDVNGGANAVGYSVQQLEQLITTQYQIPAQDFQRPESIISASVHVPDGSRGLTGGCGPIELALFVQGSAPDLNNRVCQRGTVVVPEDQLGTGGLGAAPVMLQNSPAPPPLPPAPVVAPAAPPKPRAPARHAHG